MNASTTRGSNWRPAWRDDLGRGAVGVPSELVRPLMGQRVEHVSDSGDPAGKWDVLAASGRSR